MINRLCIFIIFFAIAITVRAENYYVSPTGSDAADGQSIETAWATVDNGESLGKINPGDTVFILPGYYAPTSAIVITVSGTSDMPIVYQALGPQRPTFYGANQPGTLFDIDASYIVLKGVEIRNVPLRGIDLDGDYCTITGCYIRNVGNHGILVTGDHNEILYNIVSYPAESGIRNEGFGNYTHIYNNTVYHTGRYGIEITSTVNSVRIFNNIVAYSGTDGITAPAGNVCGFNNVWGSVEENYGSSAVDSAGGIVELPGFVDPLNGRFDLKLGSAEIDAGLGVGYPFTGSAPEMGAIEKFRTFYVSPEGNDYNDGLSPEHAWRSIGNGGPDLYPGDTVSVMSGVYADSVLILSSGMADDMISYVGVRDSSFLDASGHYAAVRLDANHIRWSAISVANASSSNMRCSGDSNLVEFCHFSNAGFYGAYMYGDDNRFFANVVRDNLYYGLLLGGGGEAINNTFYRNIQPSILVSGGDPHTIENNIFYAYSNSSLAVAATQTTVLDFCLFYGYDQPVYGEVTLGSGCIMADPMFYDADNDDFHLLSASPGIDAGINSGLPYAGAAPDIGAYETGTPTRMAITSLYPVLSADSSYQFEVEGTDSAGYPTRLGDLIWSESFPSGSITSTGLFTPQLTCTGRVIARTPDNKLADTTDYMEVVPGILKYLSVTPRRETVFIDSTLQFYADGTDAKGNFVDDLGTLSWEVLNNVGIISGSGLFTGKRVGHGFIRARSNLGPLDITDTITVLAEDMSLRIASISIPPRELIPGDATGPLLAFELTNYYPSDIIIDSLRLRSSGDDPDGATQVELDSQIENVQLYLDQDGQYSVIGEDDSLLSVATVVDGFTLLHITGLEIPAGGSIQLCASAILDQTNPKDGNKIAFELVDPAHIYTTPHAESAGEFPVGNDQLFLVNNFPLSNVVVNPLPSVSLYEGLGLKAVLDMDLPSNGYDEDRLDSIVVRNTGTLEDSDDIMEVWLFADAGDNGFTMDDLYLGQFTFRTYYWKLSGISHRLPPGTTRIFAVVRVISSQFDGGTLDFEIPTGGIQYESGTDGADDGPVKNPNWFLVIPANRITAVSIPTPSSYVYPGSADNAVLTFALYNGYSSTRDLHSVRLTNRSRTASTLGYADDELGLVSLHFDDDFNRVLDGDPAIASGYFTDGTLSLTGLDLTLPSQTLTYFFVAADLPTLGAIDSDSLAVAVEQQSDLVFDSEDEVNLNGTLPLLSGGYKIINGSVQAQYSRLRLTSTTVSPEDTSITILAFRPAYNGDQTDVLESVTLTNMGDADTSDFTDLELWADANGDNQWQYTDTQLGQFDFDDGLWTVDGLSHPTSASMPLLFVTADVTATPTPDVYFRSRIPVNGCQFSSDNDGPLDFPISAEATFTVSASALRVSAEPLNTTYSVGQTIEVKAKVSNLRATPIADVYCQFVASANPADSELVGPVTLDAGQSMEFTHPYLPAGPEVTSWQIRSFSTSEGDSSGVVTTETVTIQAVPVDVLVEMINSAPTAVSRGQSNVFPLSLRYTHPDSSPTTASIRVDSLRLTVLDGNNQPQPASAAFSRIILASDYTSLVVCEDVPSDPSVLLTFSQPVTIAPDQERLFSLRVDIDIDATATDFVISIENAAAVSVADDNTLLAVTLDPSISFPLRTAPCRIDDPSQYLAVSDSTLLEGTVNYGQEDVNILQVGMRHPGETGSSQVQLISLTMQLVDESDLPIAAEDLITSVSILRQQTVIGYLSSFQSGQSLLTVDFTAPPTLSAGEYDTLVIRANMKDYSTHDFFGLRINDSTAFEVRDLSSGSIVSAISDPILAASNVFPMHTGYTGMRHPALPPEICLISLAPETAVGGAAEVELIGVTVRYDATDEYSPLTIDDLRITVLDSLGAPLNPRDLFDQIGIAVDGGDIQYQTFIELDGGFTVFNLDNDLLISPGDTVSVVMIADIESGTPVDHFRLNLSGESGLCLRDATDTTRTPGFTLSPECAQELPLLTTTTRVFLPAGRPSLASTEHPVLLAYPGQCAVTVADMDLGYASVTLQGDILLHGLSGKVITKNRQGIYDIEASDVFSAIRLAVNGDTLTGACEMTEGGFAISLESPRIIQRGDAFALSLVCDINENAATGNYMLQFEDSTFCDMIDRNLLTQVSPVLADGSYPILSTELSITSVNLGESFTNFPNPFNPADGEVTTIGYVLAEHAYVDIELFTITGELVSRLIENSYREAGAHRSDTWDGANDKNLNVLPGTYFCRITARYTSGRQESFTRKIAVVR
ncbi:MAG: right-handed parallel beta-helix repeat-containing protein [Candidatus Zixiibacteriota bacterium]